MRRLLTVLCAVLCAAFLVACGNTASSSSFKGTEHAPAQTLSNFSSAATAGKEKKICSEDLASGVVTRLGGQQGCEAAIKAQLGQVDNLEITIESVDVAASRNERDGEGQQPAQRQETARRRCCWSRKAAAGRSQGCSERPYWRS